MSTKAIETASEEVVKDTVTQVQINEWKKKYEVYRIRIPLENEGQFAIGYVRKPNLDILGAVQAIQDSDPIQAVIVLFENCWLGGDQVITESDEAKLSASKVIAKLFKVREAEVKKL